jgi:hypothetical protein
MLVLLGLTALTGTALVLGVAVRALFTDLRFLEAMGP